VIENAKIDDEKTVHRFDGNFDTSNKDGGNTTSGIIDEIIKNNDKFETIRVIMEILCEKLEISKESQFGEIHKALLRVTQAYYKSMEDWRNISKMGKKDDIRQ